MVRQADSDGSEDANDKPFSRDRLLFPYLQSSRIYKKAPGGNFPHLRTKIKE